MKIRQGFVSNSSSTSFVIALPKEIVVTPESLRTFFFPGINELTTIGYGRVNAIPAQTAAEVIYNHISAANDIEALELDVVEGYLVPAGKRQGIILARDGILAKIDRTKENFYIVRLSSEVDDINENMLCVLAQNGLFGPAEKMRVR